MKKIELFTHEDLNRFGNNVPYFMEGADGILDLNKLPKYSSSYDRAENQIKLSECIDKMDFKEDLQERLESTISASNESIVNMLDKIKDLQSKIITSADILEEIKDMRSSKKIFIHISNRDNI